MYESLKIVGKNIALIVCPKFWLVVYMKLQASKWLLGIKQLKSGVTLTQIRAVMDDITTLTTALPCIRRLSEKLLENISWAKIKDQAIPPRSLKAGFQTKGSSTMNQYQPYPKKTHEEPWKYDASLIDCGRWMPLNKIFRRSQTTPFFWEN